MSRTHDDVWNWAEEEEEEEEEEELDGTRLVL